MKLIYNTMIVLLIAQSLCQNKVKIQFFQEALCPFCHDFVAGSFIKAIKTADFLTMADVRVYPYGNAKTTPNPDGSFDFTCQHGPDQCAGNIYLACALNLTGFTSQGLQNFACITSQGYNNKDYKTAAINCGKVNKVDFDSVVNCANSKQGGKVLADIGNYTAGLSPAKSYVPWIVVDGAHNSNDQSAIRQDMLKFVCSKYKGQKIADCPK